MRVCARVRVTAVCVHKWEKSRSTPTPRNTFKIATANPTECKSDISKGLKKTTFEGRRKTGIHFSPFTVPGEGHPTSSASLRMLYFPQVSTTGFLATAAQLYYGSWKLHRTQDEGICGVSKVEKKCIIVSACFCKNLTQEKKEGGKRETLQDKTSV